MGYLDDDGDDVQPGSPAWMATYADMTTLLLTFFVLLLSFAEMDVIAFKAVLGSVNKALGVASKNPGALEGVTAQPISFDQDNATEKSEQGIPDELIPIQRLIRNRNLDGAMKLIVTEKNVILRIHDLFPAGSASLQPKDFAQLDIVTALCRIYPQPVDVQAHTDDRPIRTQQFPSNWELSAHRAASVARYLVRAGDIAPTRVKPAGFAEFSPVSANDTEAHRRENRRVDVILAREADVPVTVNESTGW
jgi:chemotaxis protein MotB